MIVNVCDALCGQGKTQGCIAMINEDTENRYVFITPYLDEVERIVRSCRDRKFVSPERKFTNGYSKLNDLHSLLRAGENIASTHALFAWYTDETRQLLKDNNYILILDEVIDLFQPLNMDGGDVNLLVRKNIAKRQDGNIVWDDDEYTGVLFSEVQQMARCNNLIDYDGSFYFWSIPIEVFKSFKEAYVLTYLFEHSILRHFFEVNGLSYRLIGTKKVDGGHRFCPLEEMDRKIELRDKIHIVQQERYNDIGNKAFSLSSGWFDRSYQEPDQRPLMILKNNLYNVFRQFDSGAEDKMWTTLNKYRSVLKGKGYANGFITFNKRATNDFADRHCLAYCLNVFMQPWIKNYLVRIGVEDVNQDMYALSILIQWIFRSAIRKGEEIHIYIPSRRMRYLLERWLDNLADGRDLEEIKYDGRKARRNKTEERKLLKKIKDVRRRK